MTAKSGLLTALVAAVVAALVTVATLSVLTRVAPGMLALSGKAIQDNQIVDIVRNYLTKNPEILVEMTNGARQAPGGRAGGETAEGHQRKCRCHFPLAPCLRRRQP